MYSEEETALLQYGARLEEMADRYEAESGHIARPSLHDWPERLRELAHRWEDFLREQGLLPAVPDKDREDVERILDHAASWIGQGNAELVLLEKLAAKQNDLREATTRLSRELSRPEAAGLLMEALSLCDDFYDQLMGVIEDRRSPADKGS